MKKIPGILLLLTLAGCLIVHDFGEYWNKGYVDPALAGKWLDKNDNSLTFINEGDSYMINFSQRDEPVEAARTLNIGKSTFLMIKDKKVNLSGTLNLYEFKDGKLVFFGPNPAEKDDFIANYGGSGIRVGRNSVEIPKMTKGIEVVLFKITQDPKYWIATQVYTKAELEK